MRSIYRTFMPATYTDQSYAFDDIINKRHHNIKSYSGNLNLFRDLNNNNLLHVAVQIEDIEITSYLIASGVCTNQRNKFYLTPYDYAIRTHNKDIIGLFTSTRSKQDDQRYVRIEERNKRVEKRI